MKDFLLSQRVGDRVRQLSGQVGAGQQPGEFLSRQIGVGDPPPGGSRDRGSLPRL
jgi:hypothetical protein